MQINKKMMMKQIERCLKELSDSEFQKEVWLHGDSSIVSSPEEAYCQLFDDTGLSHYLLDAEKKTVVLDKDLDSILIELDLFLGKINYRESIRKILDNPNWPKIRELSLNALNIIS